MKGLRRGAGPGSANMNDRSRALRLHGYGEREGLRVDDVAPPSPQGGEVLVAVKAAGVNPLDHKLAAGWLRQGFALTLPATLGLELAGEVVALGPSAIGRFAVGDRVMGLARMNAYADLAAVPEAGLVGTPAGLSDVLAASIPVAALTAWQILRVVGELRPGCTVLVHGASGGVGGFAVQLAKASGARVLATTATESVDYVRGLGADVVFDRRVERFEEGARTSTSCSTSRAETPSRGPGPCSRPRAPSPPSRRWTSPRRHPRASADTG